MTEIITPWLIIRGFMKKDAEALYEYLKSPVTPCFYNERLNSLSEAEHEVLRRSRDQSQFAVCMRDNDVLIGHLFADNSNEPDNDTWAVGGHFNQRYEKKGYATESVTALFDYLFNKKRARRLYAWVEDYNISSRKLCQRLNMRYEGCLKEFVSFVSEDGYKKYDDTCIYAILKKEWGSLTTTTGFS